jgi:1-acyl-sn-glycerol-3-phosphate acyltransferase
LANGIVPRAATTHALPEPLVEPSRAAEPDPFDLDPAFRRAWLRPLRILFDRYWRIEVSGLEHVPDDGPALIAANHSGAVPADAFMLAVALELRQPPRCLRVLYDRFVDALPLIGPLYRRLGAFPASFPNAELMLRRGELVGLFPEGIAGVEKRYTERYRLRPFKTGTARLALRTGTPIVPVAIVGAEEAYPVVARLYRVGGLVGLPWLPITPTFPLCGVAGAVPLPSKWHMHFCPPIPAPRADGRPEEDLVAETTARLRESLATGVADLLAKRRGIFV